MLISVRHLIDRARHPRSRADDLAKLRARFDAQPSRHAASREQLRAAIALRGLRRELAETLDGVRACHRCAHNHPLPAGRWEGGHCCSGDTFRVFTADEVTALKWGGTRPRDWRAPTGDHAGCAFRGPTGCSLAPEDRPNICLRYICIELREELRDQARWARIGELSREMTAAFEVVVTPPSR